MSLIGVVGVGILCFIALMLVTVLDKDKHFILQLLLLVFVVAAMLLVPKAIVDSQTVCESVINTTTVVGNVSSYSYTDHCFTRSENTGESALQLTQRLYYLIIGYVIVALAITGLQAMIKSVKSKKETKRRNR